MASLIPWTGGFGLGLKKRDDNNVLNTLNNLDVRTNNAAANQQVNMVSNNNPNVNVRQQNQAQPTFNNFVQNEDDSPVRTLSNIDVRRSGVQNSQIKNPDLERQEELKKLQESIKNSPATNNGQMSFDEFKSVVSAKNAINDGGTGAPFKESVIQKAAEVNTGPVGRGAAQTIDNTQQKLIDSTQDRINRNKEILNKLDNTNTFSGSVNEFGEYGSGIGDISFNRNGNTLSNLSNLNVVPMKRQLENQIKKDEQSLGRYKQGERPITLSTGLGVVGDEIGQAAGNAILGEPGENEGFGKQLLRGILNLPGGIIGQGLNMPRMVEGALTPQSTTNVIQKNSDGTYDVVRRENNAINRAGSGAEFGLSLVDMLSGGEGAAIRNFMGKSAAKGLAKQAGRAALEEGFTEGAQNLAEELSQNGKWDEGTAERTAQSAVIGGVLGGLMSGVSGGAVMARNKLRNRLSQNTSFDNNGNAVRTEQNGTTTRLSDEEVARNSAELAQKATEAASNQSNVGQANPGINQNLNLTANDVIEPTTTADTASSTATRLNILNPIQDSSISSKSLAKKELENLLTRAKNGDIEAVRILEEYGYKPNNTEEQTDWRTKTVDEVINPEETEVAKQQQKDVAKEQQFETIRDKNPMQDEYHTGIRSVNDIKNFDEIMRRTPTEHDAEGDFTYPDWTKDDATRMMANGGKVTLYSSRPIEEGGFVTPSKMMAEDYAGGRGKPVFSKEVNIDDVAWITGDEGQYAPRFIQNNIFYDNTVPVRNDLAEVGEMVVPKEQNQSPVADTRLTDYLNTEGSTTERASFGDRLRQGADALTQALTGKSKMQPAYAMAEDGYSYPSRTSINNRSINGIDTTRSYSTYAGEGGKTAVKIDIPVLDGASTEEASAFIKQAVSDLSKNGTFLDVGDITELAKISRESSKKAGGATGWTKEQAIQRNEIMADIEEVSKYLHNVRFEDAKTGAKEGVIGVIKGDIEVDINGQKIYPEVIFRVYDNGAATLHDISSLDRLPNGESPNHNLGRHVRPSEAARQPSDISNIAQNPENVNVSFETPTERNSKYDKEVKRYYNKYGDDFYEKMPDNLKEHYDSMLDAQPRDKDGRYTDPITGEKWIDEDAKPDQDSSFAKNTSKNANFSEETRQALKENPISYEPATNEERLARANEILSTKSTDELDSYLRDNFINAKDKDRNSADMVLAGEFAKILDAKGQFDRSTELINKMSEIGTKQGQNIQALSLMMNRSPEGIANMAQSAIKKSGGEMTGELRGQIVKQTQEIGKIRGKRAALAKENATISKQIMSGKGDLPALRKRQMAIAQEYRINLDQEGRTFSNLSDTVSKNSPDNRSVFGAVWRAGLLSGPRTHTGNAVSNTFQNILNAGSDRFAAGLDWARSKLTGKEREIVSSAGGRGKGLGRGLKAAGEVLKTGNNLWEGSDIVTGKTTAWGQGGELEFKNKLANTMVAKPTNFVFRAMSAGDLPFRYSAWENAVRTEAKRQGINQGYRGQALQDYINSRVATPDPELQAYGIRKGNESVYDVDTKLSGIMNRVDKFIDGQDNKVVKAGMRTAKTLIAPFVKVPSKVLSTAIDYSPLGSVKAIVNKLGSKNYTTGQFETDLARSGLGTAGFVGLGYALSAAGLLTGGYPDDQNERNRWKAEGIEPNSVKIGDTYLSLNYLGPASMLMAMGSGVQQRQEKGEDALTIASGTVMDALNTFLDQSYVQGLSNALQAITDSQRYGESYVNSFARGLVPNLFRQTATATDPMQRQANDALDSVVSGIPGLSQTLDAKVDSYGREIENKQTLPLGQMWDALKLSNSRETNAVIDEVSRLHEVDPSNKDLQITPPMEDNTLSVDGTNVKITDSQKTQLQKDSGAAALKAMQDVMNSTAYASLSDNDKAKALTNARQEAQKQARKQFIAANNITADSNPETTNSAGDVTQNYAGKAISGAKSGDSNKSAIEINEGLDNSYKSILERYNSMTTDEWNSFVNGSSAESAAAEYNLEKAKFENDVANGKLTDVQKIKKQNELEKLAVSKNWTKDVREAYSLAGTKADIQELLNSITDENARANLIGMLNGLNNAMYEAGVISKSTYNTRVRNINNLTSSSSKSSRSSRSRSSGSSSSSTTSSETASAMKALAKAKAEGGNTELYKVKTTEKPTTNRSMTKTTMKKSSTKKYSPKKASISVKKANKGKE